MRRVLSVAVMVIAIAGCTAAAPHHGGLIEPAIDTPTHFLVEGSGGKTQEPSPGACRSPMIDPRDGTKITLQRSSEGRGYYRVPEGRYGVHPGELLLIECGTGRVMGVVKR